MVVSDFISYRADQSSGTASATGMDPPAGKAEEAAEALARTRKGKNVLLSQQGSHRIMVPVRLRSHQRRTPPLRSSPDNTTQPRTPMNTMLRLPRTLPARYFLTAGPSTR